MHLPFIKVGVYPHQDVFHQYLSCSDATASGQLYQVADTAKVLDVGLASLQSADDRVMSAFHNTCTSELKAIRLSHGVPLFLLETRQNATKCLRQNVRL